MQIFMDLLLKFSNKFIDFQKFPQFSDFKPAFRKITYSLLIKRFCIWRSKVVTDFFKSTISLNIWREKDWCIDLMASNLINMARKGKFVQPIRFFFIANCWWIWISVSVIFLLYTFIFSWLALLGHQMWLYNVEQSPEFGYTGWSDEPLNA